MDNIILYEHPMNEMIRVCLRLECIFAQAENHLQTTDYWNNRSAVASIVDLIDILDRPDFKTKLTQQFIQLNDSMLDLGQKDGVDQNKLNSILQVLTHHLEFLQSYQGKLSQIAEENDFLAAVRLRLAKTGGARNFDLPMYHFWLQQNNERRSTDLQTWFGYFTPVQETIEFLLSLIRKSTCFIDSEAPDAFFEKTLDKKSEYQLIRIGMPTHVNAFPEMSVGRHRLSIHFYQLNNHERPVQHKESLSFKLACCS